MKIIFKTLYLLSFIFLINCGGVLTSKNLIAAPTISLFGKWIIDSDKTTEAINKIHTPEGLDAENWEFGKQMLLGMY